MLQKKDILDVDDRPTREVRIKEWHNSVLVKAISAADRDDFERLFRDNSNKHSLRAWCASRFLVDSEGNRLFTDADLPALAEKSAEALDRILEAGLELSGMSKGGVEELEKN